MRSSQESPFTSAVVSFLLWRKVRTLDSTRFRRILGTCSRCGRPARTSCLSFSRACGSRSISIFVRVSPLASRLAVFGHCGLNRPVGPWASHAPYSSCPQTTIITMSGRAGGLYGGIQFTTTKPFANQEAPVSSSSTPLKPTPTEKHLPEQQSTGEAQPSTSNQTPADSGSASTKASAGIASLP